MSCNCGCVPNTADNESLPSALENFILSFYGSVTKSVVDGKVSWTLPCDLATGIPGHPRVDGEGLACYFKRVLGEGITGLNGKNAYALTTANFTQPAIGDTVVVSVDQNDSFFVDQYVAVSSDAGFYLVTAIGTNTITLKNLYGPPFNLSASSVIATGAKVVPSGVPETAGPQGAQGDPGATGATGPTGYTGYTGPSGTTGADGPPGSEPARFWDFTAAGTHYWTCPVGVTQLRVRCYGAGGGGGGGASTANGSGSGHGAGGGEYADKVVTVTPATIYQAVVGAGGTGGTGGDSTANGTDGGNTSFADSFTTFLSANGGHGGGAAVGGSAGTGGTGGTGAADARLDGLDGYLVNGGHCARRGAGGLGDGAGESPGGGGGAGIGDGGGAGAPGAQGANGMVTIEVV